MIFHKAGLVFMLLLFLLWGCAPAGMPTPEPTTLTVLAAASLTGAFEEMGAAFEAQNPGVKVTFNFAGSQQLAQQINGGAPADVFASADPKNMDAAAGSGRLESPALFAANRLVVVTPAGAPALALADLAKPGLKLVLADPSVPVGRYAARFLTLAEADPAFGPGYKDAVLANTVSYEANVKAVLAKVTLGEADAGIVYATDAAAPQGQAANPVRVIEIPTALNPRALYPIAALKDSPHPELARAFVAFCRSSAGQAILKKYGFEPPAP